MEVASKKSGKISRNGVVVAGSVWENRLRFDEFKGGINVYSEKERTPQVENDEKTSTPTNNHQVQVDKKKLEMGSKTNDLDVGFVMSSGGKRKTWKSESNLEGNSVQVSSRKRSEFGKNLNEHCKELSVGAMKRSPMSKKNVSPNGHLRNSVQLRKVKDESSKNFDVIEENKVVVDESKKKNLERVFGESSDGNEGSRIQLKLEKCEEVDENFNKCDVIEENEVVLADSKENLERVFGESGDGNEGNRIQLREVKSDANKAENEDDGNEGKADVHDESKKNLGGVLGESDGNEGNQIQLMEVKSEATKTANEEGNEGNRIQLREVKSSTSKAENEKNCELRKVKSVCLDGNLRNSLQLVKTKSEEKCKKNFEENKVVVVAAVLDESKKNLQVSLEGIERKSRLEENCEEKVIRSNNVEPQEKSNLENEDFKILEKEINSAEQIKTKKIVIVGENKVHISNNEKKPVSISPIIKKQSPPISGQSRIHHHLPSPSRTKPGKSIS